MPECIFTHLFFHMHCVTNIMSTHAAQMCALEFVAALRQFASKVERTATVVLLCGHRAKRAAEHNSHNDRASTRSRHNILVIKWKVASFNVALIRRTLVHRI